MSKIAYLDCPTGIAGDMCLGALVDVGVPLAYLIEQLGRLGIADEYRLWSEQVHRNGQQATKVHVDLHVDQLLRGADAIATDSVQTQTSAIAVQTTHAVSHHHTHSATERSVLTGTDSTHAHAHSQSHTHNHTDTSNRTDHSTDHPSEQSSAVDRAADPLHSTHPHGLVRHLPEVERLILAAHLPARAEAWSLAVFRRLAEAEGAIHGVPPEQVHFHEVGATDAIVDIVGTCLGLDWLQIDQLYCSPLPTGGGTVRAAHGRLPVPAPAVLRLFELRQTPIYSNGIEREMVTPTGAAIATTLATQFGSPPKMTLNRVGLGAGSISLPLPNILRLWIGEGGEPGARSQESGARETQGVDDRELKTQSVSDPIPVRLSAHVEAHTQTIALLETQIDDLSPQAIGYVYEALFAVGALDVYTQAIAMKKSRPGILLTVICLPETISDCEAVMFRETTTLGIRRSTQQRRVLHREIQSVETEYGTVRVKVAWLDRAQPHPTNVQPEYEDCARLARQHNLPWREIHRLALQTWYRQEA